jgi:large subunit ribosomal protein L10
MSMVSQKKTQMLKEISGMLKQHPVIGILDMHKLPGRQLHDIRNKLRGEATIRMAKKRIIDIALKESNLTELGPYLTGEPALLFSSSNPFKLAQKIMASTSKAAAKEGDIAPRNIEIKAGPTPLSAGPVIGELQRLKIPCAVEHEKIAVKQDKVVAKAGEVITKPMAEVLAKLGIEPMEIKLNLVAAWEKGSIYTKDILFVTQEEYITQIRESVQKAFNLSLSINYFTKETIPLLLSKAHREALALCTRANIITPATAGSVLAQAHAAAAGIEKRLHK